MVTTSLLRRLLAHCVVGAFAAVVSTGCVESIAPLVRFDGEAQTEALTWQSGDNVCVDSINGHVGIVVAEGTSELSVRFQPFSVRRSHDEESARIDIANFLQVEARLRPGSCAVQIKTWRIGGASTGLGADVEVTLPSGFDAGINVDQNGGAVVVDLTGNSPTYVNIDSETGEVTVKGAGGRLDIDVDDGDTSISVDSWSWEDGKVKVGNGGLDFDVKSGLKGFIYANAEGEATLVDGPTSGGWVEDAATPTSKSYEFGDPDAVLNGRVFLTARNGDITIREH